MLTIGRNDEDRKTAPYAYRYTAPIFVSLTLRPIFIVENQRRVPNSLIITPTRATINENAFQRHIAVRCAQ